MRHSSAAAFVGHLIAAALFAVATAVWLGPLLRRFGTAIPGVAAGDNVTFLWNVWWVRHALTHHLPLLSTPMLQYPFGADLTLHTHTLLPSLAVSLLSNPVVAQNLLVAVHLFLNFACAYFLAWRETRAWAPAILAAFIFGWSPYIAAHLTGHFNLIAAWVLPLSALLARKAIADSRASSGILLGVELGAVAYIDYYYFVYACLLVGLLALTSCTSVLLRPSPIARRATALSMRGLAIVAGMALAAAALIALSGGSVWRLGGRTISVRSVRNPMAAAWLCGMLALLIHVLCTRSVRFDSTVARRLRGPALAASLLLVATISPLLWHGAAAARAGTYVGQPYLWRGAPAGIDLVTLIAGNPSSALYGTFARPLYDGWGVNLVEHVGWVGPGTIALALIGVMTAPGRRRWLFALLVFGVWALGPSLRAAGNATSLWMPAVVVRWIPIVANARIPARAVAVVYLACAMLAAHGMRRLLRHRRTALASGLCALALVDLAPAPTPVFVLPRPAAAELMASDPRPGAVLPLPFGTRDGFGETGRLDPEAMWLQTIHHRPIAGGSVARLPRDITDRYRQMPVLGSLLRLSGGERLTESQIAAGGAVADKLLAAGFRYVVVNRRLANPDLQHYIERVLSAPAIWQDEEYRTYRVEGPKAHPDAAARGSS